MSRIIDVVDLKKSYGDVEAVKGICFHVNEGDLFAFLGPNGAGKSTTIDILCTLLKQNSGKVLIDGYELGKQDDAIRSTIGVVFQDSLLDPLLTVRENLNVRAKFYTKDKAQIKCAIQTAAEVADITDFIDRPYGKLSGGQRRRTDIARALVHTPKVLFLDEPTTGLDPQTRKSVWNTIRKLQKEQGMTIFLTTHYMEEAANADYVVIIDHGLISAKGTPYELKEQYSHDILKIKPNDEQALLAFLGSKRLSYKKKTELYHIKLKSTVQAIPIIKQSEHLIESFEVVRGTMDDVFITVTGKEMRENA
jgi:multidrug/hemolysin transport system ATP-binding protein